MITFEEFANSLFTSRQSGKNLVICAFDDEVYINGFVHHNRNTEGLIFVHSSDFKPHVTLKDKWCKAEVIEIFAVDTDLFAVLLVAEDEE